jgi:hypothetical protein
MRNKRIVTILDKFDTLTNSITEGLLVKSSYARNSTSTIVICCSASRNQKPPATDRPLIPVGYVFTRPVSGFRNTGRCF